MSVRKSQNIEIRRLQLQAELDGTKSQYERNMLGQFATPTDLAHDLLSYAKTFFPKGKSVRFLDPAIGTGSFYSAFLKAFPKTARKSAVGYEIDPHYGKRSIEFWEGSDLSIRLKDFTKQNPSDFFDLLICNPPYVRHHHLSLNEKIRLQSCAQRIGGVKIGGLSGLYCYFLAMSHGWLAENAISGWLIPSEFMDVNYGSALKEYLLSKVTLIHIHRFDPKDVQFSDALVSSAVVWFRNSLPPENHEVKFTFGGRLSEPVVSKQIPASVLSKEKKWTRFPVLEMRGKNTEPTISDFFEIKRGLATGNNKFFIVSQDEIFRHGLPKEVLKPILPSPRYISGDEVKGDRAGNPLVNNKLFLIDSSLDEAVIKIQFPNFWKYLKNGKSQNVDRGYLCSRRTPWYSQEKRLPPPIVCTYFGRSDSKNGRVFRFILNRSKATVTNVYLAMYPRPAIAKIIESDPQSIEAIWKILNRISSKALLSEGRVYGGALHKLEPKELGNVAASEIAHFITNYRVLQHIAAE